MSIIIISLIGLLLSVYALYVEKKSDKDKSYKAVCDIHEKASCTKAFSSNYGRIAGISNSTVGIFFYLIVVLLEFYNFSHYVFYLSILSMLGTFYLAYLQYFKLKNFCIVCSLIYILNLLLLIFSYSQGR